MVHSMRTVVLGLVFGLLAALLAATPTLAAGTPFHATYPDERSTFRTCPPGLPAGAICFTGVGHGPTVVGATSLAGTEDYAGFIDPNNIDPVTHCPVDRNAVAITTNSGTLFLTTKGSGTGPACGPVDNGTWQAFGGTGIFEGATGTGTVSTLTTGFNPDGTINSSSTYTGTLNLHSE